jgi:nucleolar protein 56
MEERLQFLATGAKPTKNKDAMKEVLDELKAEGLYYDGAANGKNGNKKSKKDTKKKKVESSSDEESSDEDAKKKKKKGDKKK